MKKESLTDPDMQAATAALMRAAQRARLIAQQTGTAIIFVRDGQLVREVPTKGTENQSSTEVGE
ncbi:MAG: hypothetical protein P4L53_22820 [Candidatus Obscuribacterales bacterium]|nr:hypothetical protein [Candidatus Obscuribacterales bacterium]